MAEDRKEVATLHKTAVAAVLHRRAAAVSTRDKRAARLEAERLAHFKRGIDGR